MIIYYGLLEDTFGENSAEKLYKKIIEINGGDVYRMLFTDDRHKSRFNNFYKFAVKNGYEIIESNKNIALVGKRIFMGTGKECYCGQ